MVGQVKKVFILYPTNSRNHCEDDLFEKYDKSQLVDNDLSDPTLFHVLRTEVFMDPNTHPDDRSTMKVWTVFCPLKQSTLLLCDLLVFGTTSEILCYTKFLISQLHGGSLWLDQEYPIHAIYIHNDYRIFFLWCQR